MEKIIKSYEKVIGVIILLVYIIWTFKGKPDSSNEFEVIRRFYTLNTYILFLISTVFLLVREGILAFRINNLPVEIVSAKNNVLISIFTICLIVSNVVYYQIVFNNVELFPIEIFMPFIVMVLGILHAKNIYKGEEYFIYIDTKYYYDCISEVNFKNPTTIKMIINGKNKNITTYSSTRYTLIENILKENIKTIIEDVG